MSDLDADETMSDHAVEQGQSSRFESKLEQLYEAAAKNDVNQLIELISRSQSEGDYYIDLNDRHAIFTETLFCIAAYCNRGSSHFEVIELLLKNGAVVNAKDDELRSPLWYLVKNCNLDILKLFLKYKADFTYLDEYEYSLLRSAIENDQLDVVKFLVRDVGLNVNHKNKFGKNILHEVTSNDECQIHYDVLEFLLENGADVNAKDDSGSTPLWYLVQNCDSETLKLFFRFKANFNDTNNDGELLLVKAACTRNLDVVKFLVEDVGLDVNCIGLDAKTPLHSASKENNVDTHYEVMKYLLEMGANPNVRDVHGLKSLYYLIKHGCNWKVVELFLKHNADVHKVSSYSCNIIFAFNVGRSDAQVLDKLLNADLDLDVNQTAVNKWTPLHLIFDSLYLDSFSNSINIEVLKCFVKNGANVNAFDSEGATPLYEIVHEINQESDEDFFLKNKMSLDFLLEQTDFSCIHDNSHIFIRHRNHRPLENYLWKWILEHLAKLEFLSIQVHPILLNFIGNHNDYKDYFTECKEELRAMSNSKPQNSWISFFNVLVNGRRKLKNYAGNNDLIEDYQNNNWLDKFPIYGASMKKNLEKGIKRRKLFDESAILLSDCLPIFNSTHLIVKDILDCILSKKDLSKFCKRRYLR